MAQKRFELKSISSYFSPRSGYSMIGRSNDSPATNCYATLTFPPIIVPGAIQEVKIYFPWNNTAAGQGTATGTYHAAGNNGEHRYYISGVSGTISVAIDDYSTASDWTLYVSGAETAPNTYKGYSWSIYAIVTYLDQSAPTAPTYVSCTPSIFENTLNIGWGGAQDGAGNPISEYHIHYQLSNDGSNWSGDIVIDTNSKSTSYVFDTSKMGHGMSFRCRVYSIGVTLNSPASPYSNTARKYRPAVAPVVANPLSGGVIYDAQPRILIKTNPDPDNALQRIQVQIPNVGWVNNEDDPEYFSINNWLGPQVGLICRLPPMSGNVSIGIRSEKRNGPISSTVNMSFTVAEPAWTDSTLTVHETLVKAAHMNELRDKVDNILLFYGMNIVPWRDTIIEGETMLSQWIPHINEVRSAIESILSFVNNYDMSANKFDIPNPSWVSVSSPQAGAVQQVRDVIETL